MTGPLGEGADRIPVDRPVDTVTLTAAARVLLGRYLGVTDLAPIQVTAMEDGLFVPHDPALTAGLTEDLDIVLAGLAEGLPERDLLPRAAPERQPAPDPADAHVTGPGFVPFGDLDGSIVDRFLRQVDRHGDRAAVVTPGETVTYGELAARAAGIATALYEAGAGPGTRVALLLDHGRDTIAAILGVLWTGAAHVPLDPSYPVDRLAHMLGHAEAAAVVTTGVHRGLMAKLGAAPRVVDLDHVPPADPPPSKATADSPAYILYTSGSTGLPKGVVQTHRNVLFQIRNHTNNLRITPEDRVSLLSSFSFDMAVTDLFSALLNGAAVVPLDLRGGALTGLARTLTDLGVTVYHSTPTVYRHLLAGGETLGRIRAVLLGGEPVTGEDVERSRPYLRADAVVINGYGATEVSFAAQHHLLLADTPARPGVVPIGHPLEGVEIVLLGLGGRPAALYGEIGIRSRYVSVGYWRDPELNARKFRVAADGTRTYLTGDLARRLPDGSLVYLGRDDRQVKIRGYRVELGEIEAALHTDPGVGQAVAVARGTELVAYVEGTVEGGVDPAALRARLAETLPHFMVPRTIVAMAAFPLTPTGKVDVRALPAPDVVQPASAPPEGPVESRIAAAWCAVLGVPAVGRDDNFFELGGTSLTLARVQERLGGQVRLTTMLEHPTVAGLAKAMSGGTKADPALSAVADRMARRRHARRGGA